MSEIYNQRKAALEYIFSLNEEDFEKMLKTNTIPVFVPAEEGDPDWELQLRDFSASPGLDWAWWNRYRLKTMSVEIFLDIVGPLDQDANLS